MNKENIGKHVRRVEPVDFLAENHSNQVDSSSGNGRLNKKHPDQPSPIKRVAAYARVSTEQEEQEGSFQTQIDYYTNYIMNHPNWRFVRVYADHGISGTTYKYRPAFLRMIEDAKRGKIDLILTKSISRFSRNTVDAISITRELKANGVEIYFEKENLSSFDSSAELTFTILSAIAQEESRALSENVRWGKERSKEAGKVSVPYKHFLGYQRGDNGEPVINKEDAKIVRKIYSLFLSGKSYHAIAVEMTRDGILTPTGRLNWTTATIKSILTNEKYMGDARLGKTYIADYLTHKVKVNRGERKQYYVRNTHEAIITRNTFMMVQEKIAQSKSGI